MHNLILYIIHDKSLMFAFCVQPLCVYFDYRIVLHSRLASLYYSCFDADMCKTTHMRLCINGCSGLFAKGSYAAVTCKLSRVIKLLKIGGIYNQSRCRYRSYALKLNKYLII